MKVLHVQIFIICFSRCIFKTLLKRYGTIKSVHYFTNYVMYSVNKILLKLHGILISLKDNLRRFIGK